MLKNLLTAIFSALLILSFAAFENVSAQNKDDGGFLSTEFLRSDYRQVKVVLHVNVTSYELVDSLGNKNCKENTGGYCLYRLKADVKEIFKGKIKKENFAFYTVLEGSSNSKDFLLGEKLVFLNWSTNYPDKKRALGTMENSTRPIETGVLQKMRKIAKKKR
jgi:hypothetical protein